MKPRTVRISLKHIERTIFSVIIIVLLVMLIQAKGGIPMFGTALEKTTSHSIKDLLPTDVTLDSMTDNSNVTTTTSPSETTTTVTAEKTTTTTTKLAEELSIKAGNVIYDKLDDEKAKIESFYIEIENGLETDLYLTLKYYIYDSDSSVSSFERITPKKPFIDIGPLASQAKYTKRLTIDKYVFNLDEEKIIKFELVDEDNDISESVTTSFDVK